MALCIADGAGAKQKTVPTGRHADVGAVPLLERTQLQFKTWAGLSALTIGTVPFSWAVGPG